mmetsp:Transcript_20820/g.24052  ORF Transcript_20820/g.24052 Transcript_20820/m.24052 type:complete len:135 (+) Transcript_20820:39-443(+)|eukprot:CAMPEP_0176452326 /NCGR_PEP_ID=MMETSP0127-20121128/28463_1 /TAXON_ID=938130 /ORGANISM="Platyophrya macrostoma, Strain WH" /LENGTH=134 /DNA_ID=CAMNT_0017840747 /DNA_START=39 /DNA_END=443 /DNA_ORIENTATION=+
MEAKKTGPQNPSEIPMHYNKLRQEYGQIFKVIIDLEEEKKEHLLVKEAMKDLEKERKCWRLVGGVLVERTVGEVLPSLEGNVEMIEKTLAMYNEGLKKKEKDIFEFEREYGLKSDTKKKPEEGKTEAKMTGVLA